MTEATQSAKKWEGRVIDGIFPLQQLLGETDHSAVFLTEYAEGETKKKAAIKLVGAEGANADLQLANWNFAAHLTHPNLLRLFRCGRCSVDGNDLLYLAMEHAEEDLADILPQRALTADETRDMLLPVLDALEFLHGKGLVHRDIKPANILASGDQLKLSSDTITRVAEGLGVAKKAGVYDPPEAISGVLSPAGDVWALGTTLVEVLTQKLPEWQPGPHREPVVPANVPAPFLEIARHCLRLEPDRRMRVADIAARLNPRAVAAAAASATAAATRTAVSRAPMTPPVTPAMAELNTAASVRVTPAPRPQASVPVAPREPVQKLPAPPVRPETYEAPRSRPRFIVPLIAGAVVFAVVLTVPRLLTRRPAAPVSTSETRPDSPEGRTASKSPPAAKPEAKAGSSPRVVSSPPPADNLKTTAEKESPTVAASPAPQVSGAAARTAAPGRPARGEVLDQVLPDVSQKARDTIRGSVRVSVKVHVDSAGAVSGAELDSPGPSQYFANLALQASKRWAFTPPEVDGKSVESDWVLRFAFTPTDTKVTPTQTAP